MNDKLRWAIMTVLLVISFLVFDRHEMIWTYLVWGAMVVVIGVDFALDQKRRDNLKQK